jgi:hypothetical protein
MLQWVFVLKSTSVIEHCIGYVGHVNIRVGEVLQYSGTITLKYMHTIDLNSCA